MRSKKQGQDQDQDEQKKWTKQFVQSIAVTGQRQTFRAPDCKGLILRVGASGAKSYAYDYRDPQGNRQTFTLGDATRIDPGEARKRVKRLGEDPAGELRQKREAEKRAASRTLRAFAEGRYWQECLATKRSGAATKARILAAWAPFLDDDMAGLDPTDLHSYRQERLEDVEPQTLNRDRTALLAMLNKAVEWRLLDRNPADDPAFKPLETDDDKRVRWLGQHDEHEEIRNEDGDKVGERARFMAALDHADTPAYLRNICKLALNTGMRRGELFQLKWADVSLTHAQITVRAVTSKSAKTRHVPLNAAALAVLEPLAKVRHIKGYVFTNPETDEPFTTLKKSWATLVERAKLMDFTFHDQRHDFASQLVQRGVDLYQVRDLLGHSSITLTERYAHLAPHAARSAVALLDVA